MAEDAYPGLLIAVDFDGTLCEASYPMCGKPLPGAIEGVKALAEKHTLILWTCRSGEALKNAKEWLEMHWILDCFVAFNEHEPSVFNAFKNDTRKIAADIYIDDRNIGCIADGHLDWSKVMAQMEIVEERYTTFLAAIKEKVKEL